jgi:hypothetical protein
MPLNMQTWLRDWLGITKIEEKLVDLELRMSRFEEQVSFTLKHFGTSEPICAWSIAAQIAAVVIAGQIQVIFYAIWKIYI